MIFHYFRIYTIISGVVSGLEIITSQWQHCPGKVMSRPDYSSDGSAHLNPLRLGFAEIMADAVEEAWFADHQIREIHASNLSLCTSHTHCSAIEIFSTSISDSTNMAYVTRAQSPAIK